MLSAFKTIILSKISKIENQKTINKCKSAKSELSTFEINQKYKYGKV